MRALKLGFAPHRVAAALAAGRFKSDLYHGGRGSPLRLVDVPSPERPRGWVRVRPLLGGICASDRKLLHLTGMGTTLMAFYGLPRGGMIPGHEVVGVVAEADGGVSAGGASQGRGVSEGDRVVLEPLLSCVDKRLPICERCDRGDDHLCAHFADLGSATRGIGFGLNARYGGGWAEELVAPAHRAFPVPDSLDDRSAVLAEPTAIAVHAVARNLPEPGQRVLVVGPGAIGLALVLALRALAPDVEVTVAGVHPASDPFATSVGAHRLLHGTRRGLIEGAAEQLDSPLRGNRISGLVLEDGFDQVFDAVGLRQTLDDAFRLVRPRGKVVLVGTSTNQEVDWSLVWHRELTVVGTAYYGAEDVTERARVSSSAVGDLAVVASSAVGDPAVAASSAVGDPAVVSPGRRRAHDIALDVLVDARPAHLVTHVFPLDEAVAALDASAAGPAAGAVKVAFDPTS